MKYRVPPRGAGSLTASQFREYVHELLFFAGGAERLGAVRCTVLWCFVGRHADELDRAGSQRRHEIATLLPLLRRLVKQPVDAGAVENLMARVRQLEAGPRSLRDWVPDRSFHRVADPGVPGPD